MAPDSSLQIVFFWTFLFYHQFNVFVYIIINMFLPNIDVDNNIYF